MRALTICQPYAELIISGEKRVENRTWPRCGPDYIVTRCNGPLLIHAGQSKKWLKTHSPLPEHMDFGRIIGTVDVVGMVRRDSPLAPKWFEDYVHAVGPVCWMLKNPQRFETPIPYCGQQRIWYVPDSVYANVPLLPTEIRQD